MQGRCTVSPNPEDRAWERSTASAPCPQGSLMDPLTVVAARYVTFHPPPSMGGFNCLCLPPFSLNDRAINLFYEP